MTKTALITIILLSSQLLFGQELDFKVNVSSPANVSTDPKVFEKLETELTELLNSTRWTEEDYEEHEKIKGQLSITITNEVSVSNFEAELSVISARPIFGSTYTSQLIKYQDKSVNFNYDGVRPVQRTENNYIDPLSSIISFYAYIIIGMDYDSFSDKGGDPYFDKAYVIYESLPSVVQRGDKGWSNNSISQQNRFYLLDNVRNPSLSQFRTAFYEYHRLALDIFHEDPDKGRAILTSAITQMGENDKRFPRSILIRMFSDAKELEISEVYKPAAKGERTKVGKIMSTINPLKASVYNNL